MRPMKRFLAASLSAAALAALSGCATWDCRFKPKVTVWFINDLNDVLKVDYAPESREIPLYREDGTSFKYKSSFKARVTFPGGYRFVAYDVPSDSVGKLYRSDDDEWELLAAGFACRVVQYSEDGEPAVVFEGINCAQDGGGMSSGNRRKGERVYNSPREHGDTNRKPKQVKK